MARSTTNTRINLALSSTFRNTLDDGSIAAINHPALSYAKTLTDGIGHNQADRAWVSKNRTLAAAASETLSLYNMTDVDIGAGAGRDGLGQLVIIEEIVAIAIVNENAVGSAGRLEIAPDATQGWTPIGTHSVATGGALAGQGVLLKIAPDMNAFVVEGGDNHNITLTANGGDVDYSIYVLGRHDVDESSSSSSSSSSLSSSSFSSSSSSLGP